MIKKPLIIFLTILFTCPAWGFVLRTTDNGSLIRWRADVITVHLDNSLEELGNLDEVHATIIDAFENWQFDAGIEIEFEFLAGSCTPGYTPVGISSNCIFVSKNTIGENDAGATTSTTFSTVDGEIIDGDIAFHVDAGDWSLTPESGKIDLPTVALHEIGHFLGLTHSQVNQAVMYPSTNIHETRLAALHEDDIWGAEALYDTGKIAEQTSCSAVSVGNQSFTGVISLLLELI